MVIDWWRIVYVKLCNLMFQLVFVNTLNMRFAMVFQNPITLLPLVAVLSKEFSLLPVYVIV